jgi:tripartite tricarboxylate transporter TctB family protein
MVRRAESLLFTSFIGLVILAALLVAKDWPVRASIVILLLGSVGAVLAVCQLVLDFKALRGAGGKTARPTFEVEALEHQGRWGSLEIWAWLWGLFLAIHLIGYLTALPLFVFLYVKLYGGSWPPAVILAGGTWAFLYGIFDQVLNVPWPKPWLSFLF